MKKERIMETVSSLGPRENPIQHNCRSGIIGDSKKTRRRQGDLVGT